jgi:hypothetical protein
MDTGSFLNPFNYKLAIITLLHLLLRRIVVPCCAIERVQPKSSTTMRPQVTFEQECDAGVNYVNLCAVT